MRSLRALPLLLCLALALPAPAGAFFFQENSGPQSATNGLVIGPDGNFWIAEQYSDSVVRTSLAGQVLGRWDVGTSPTTVAVGPGGRIWVAVTGAKKLTWFDSTQAEPTPNDVSTGFGCGPVGLTAGSDGRMYFSLPNPDGNCSGDVIGSVAGDGTGSISTQSAGGGRVYDLQVVGNKLFAPDFNTAVVRRLSLDSSLTVETEVDVPTEGAEPDGITADPAGNLWLTEYGSGKVARFPASQDGGTTTEFTPPPGTIQAPFGIVMGADGRIYVASKETATIARLNPKNGRFQFYVLPDSEPLDIINGIDGDLWFSDQKKTRIVRLVNSRPRVAAGKPRATGPTSASAKALIDPRGNETRVIFDYGRGKRLKHHTKPVIVPNGASIVQVTGVLAKLKSETRYKVRARAVNAEGTTRAATHKVKTAPFPELSTSTSIRVFVQGGATVIQGIEITRLRGTETATITCRGGSCPFSRKRFRLRGKSKSFGSSLFGGRHLGSGTTVSVRVTAPRTIGTSTVLKVRGSSPRIKRGCVRPGAKRASKCP